MVKKAGLAGSLREANIVFSPGKRKKASEGAATRDRVTG